MFERPIPPHERHRRNRYEPDHNDLLEELKRLNEKVDRLERLIK